MLKKVILLLVVTVVLVGCGKEYKGTFSYTPEKPVPGQEILVRFNPANTVLAKMQPVAMLVYAYGAQETRVTEIAMQKKGAGWQAAVTPDSGAQLLVAVFQSESETENNSDQGYKIPLNGPDGKVLPQSLVKLADVIAFGGYPLRLERNARAGLDTLVYVFSTFPEQKEKYRELYWSLIIQNDPAAGPGQVLAELDQLATRSDLTLADKKLMGNFYQKVNQPVRAEIYLQEIRQAEPKGELVQFERYREVIKTEDANQKIALAKQFLADFPDSKRNSNIAAMAINTLVKASRYDEAQNFLTRELVRPEASHFNMIAWDLAEKGINFRTAVEMAQQGVEIARKNLEAPLSEKPAYLTEKEWRGDAKYALADILDTYAFALHKNGQVKEAVPIFEEAVAIYKNDNPEMNTRLAQALIDAGESQKAFDFLENLLKEGKGGTEVQQLFKQIYPVAKGSEKGLDEALTALNAQGLEKAKQELVKQELHLPAPDFTLVDLAGNSVQLKDFKGKTVVLDFWATWCGPCIRSFPGMQKAVTKFQDDDKVKFLFVNAWEREQNIRTRVGKFINDNQYTFHVLLDSTSQVISSYKVDGIPTKFIVDKNGVIRFKSVGYGGDNDKMVEELSLMIDMAR